MPVAKKMPQQVSSRDMSYWCSATSIKGEHGFSLMASNSGRICGLPRMICKGSARPGICFSPSAYPRLNVNRFIGIRPSIRIRLTCLISTCSFYLVAWTEDFKRDVKSSFRYTLNWPSSADHFKRENRIFFTSALGD